MRTPIAFLLFCGLAFLSGCTRTSDGSVQLQPMALPAMPTLKFGEWPGFRRKPSTLATATQFPSAPQTQAVAVVQPQPVATTRRPARPAARSKARLKVPRIAVATPFKPAPTDDTKPLACRNETQPGGRIKVVCD